MFAQAAGRGTAEITFRSRSGVSITCPNQPGARLQAYEQFTEDGYRLDRFPRAPEVAADPRTRCRGARRCVRLPSGRPQPPVELRLRRTLGRDRRLSRAQRLGQRPGDRVSAHRTAMSAETGLRHPRRQRRCITTAIRAPAVTQFRFPPSASPSSWQGRLARSTWSSSTARPASTNLSSDPHRQAGGPCSASSCNIPPGGRAVLVFASVLVRGGRAARGREPRHHRLAKHRMALPRRDLPRRLRHGRRMTLTQHVLPLRCQLQPALSRAAK
jgi:hypothetical protein